MIYEIKEEYREGLALKRKKKLKITGIIVLIAIVWSILSYVFLALFSERPYTAEDVFIAVILPLAIIPLTVLSVGFLVEKIHFSKQEKKKKFLPLSPQEIKAEKINSPGQYAVWLNNYLKDCYSKQLNPLQLETLEEHYGVYYNKESDMFDNFKGGNYGNKSDEF